MQISPDRLAACYTRALPGGQVDKALRGEIETYLKEFAVGHDFPSRPYMSMITAAIFAQLGLYEAGIAHLDVWLRNQDASTIESRWLRLRALNIVIYITGYWIRAEGASASIILRGFHIARLEEALSILDFLYGFGSEMRDSRQRLTLDDFARTSFSRPPSETTKCTNQNMSKIRPETQGSLKTTYAWYVERAAETAHHQLLHPDYAKKYAHTVNTTVPEVLLTDLGCAALSQEGKLALRAFALRLFATMHLQDVIALRGTLPKPKLEDRLEQAARAAELGIIMLRTPAEEKIQEKEKQKNTKKDDNTKKEAKILPVLDRLATTPTIATFQELLRVKEQIADARVKLD
jgi:hypothetical protein